MSETPVPAPAPAAPAGRGISIAGIIFAFLIPLLGLILSIVGLVQARSAGQKNGLAVAGIIISIVVPIIIVIVAIAIPASILGAQCAELGPGFHDLGNGSSITCG